MDEGESRGNEMGHPGPLVPGASAREVPQASSQCAHKLGRRPAGQEAYTARVESPRRGPGLRGPALLKIAGPAGSAQPRGRVYVYGTRRGRQGGPACAAACAQGRSLPPRLHAREGRGAAAGPICCASVRSGWLMYRARPGLVARYAMATGAGVAGSAARQLAAAARRPWGSPAG